MHIGPDLCMTVTGSPQYLAGKTLPVVPNDLTGHRCINRRLPTLGGLYAWEFEKGGRPVAVRVQGQAVFNNSFLILQAALDGQGLAYLPEDVVQPPIEAGRLLPVLQDWWPRLSGHHLYYASRRQVAPALALVIEALRYRGQALSSR